MRLKIKKPNDRVAVALVLCFCVVAIASIFSMRSNFDQLNLDSKENINIAKDDKSIINREQDVVKPVPTVDSTVPKQNQSGEQQGTTVREDAAASFSIPLKGKVNKGFSMEEPVYSKTLDQYIIHSGIDIEAPVDTQILAAGDGTVTKVYKDDKLGITIEVSHGNGIVTRYSNLSTNKMVGEGDVLKKGQPISGVGSSALFESLEPPHLHFEVLKDGVAIDPTNYIK
ncbi:MAG: M23 family metallopeptidase [Eubacteriales bacterium]|nr:M23 family metallopeptidase [Eubacteriales bacterium]MDD3199984.1 M23 family metallopeptidase [Eubacteriales bacterium]MDD4122340.1 M23 family metallopeptidase [Eubacteriales bacterium]MDD4630193.1 M23 family metallopeptidase [Eubacteriales bacterium]